MDIKGFKSRDGSKHQYDYNALANKPDVVSGKDGGYYTPAVTQLDEKTVQFDFTPSKEGMPAVESVTVELPVGEDSGENTGYATETWVQEGFQPKGEYLTEAPVDSINGKTGAVNLTAADVKARPDTWTPTAQEVGALPSTYTPPDQTAEQVGADPMGTAASAVSAHNTNTEAHGDLRETVRKLQEQVAKFLNVDDTTRDELSEVLALIDANADVIEAITTSKVSVADIVDNLVTNVANKPLSAAQGVALKALIDGLASGKLDASKLSEAVNAALAQAKASGEFDGKDGVTPHIGDNGNWYLGSTDTGVKAEGSNGRGIVSNVRTAGNGAAGTVDTYTTTYTDGTTSTYQVLNGGNGRDGDDGYTPVRGTDYWTQADKDEIYNYIATELAKRGQLKPEFANSIEECIDTTKLYVLPDGMIYAWMLTEKEVTSGGGDYTNILPLAVNADGTEYVGENGEDGFKTDWRLNSSKVEVAESGMCCTGFMPIAPCTIGTLYLKNITPGGTKGGYLYAFGDDRATGKGTNSSVSSALDSKFDSATGVYKVTVGQNDNPDLTGFSGLGTAHYLRLSIGNINENTIITWNEEITESTTEIVKEYAWASTGHAFVPADYEDRIIAVEKSATEHTAKIAALEKAVETGGADESEKAAYTRMKNWKYPIHEDAPVFLLETDKPAIPSTDWNTNAVYAKYDALMNANSHYITKQDCGMASDGTTPIYVYHFKEPEPHYNGTWSETKPVILVCSGVHPTEQSGVWSMYYAMEEVTTNKKLADLRRNIHFVVMPMINPTGFTDSTYGVRNPDGIQVHYNFEVDFKYPTDSGYVAHGNRNHGGETPLSIPETQYFDALMQEYKDTLACVLSCHNNDVDTQWGTGFVWSSCATHFMCNLGFRLVDKLSAAWREKHGAAFDEGVRWANEYALTKMAEGSSIFTACKEQAEWDYRVGRASISGSGGTEYKQALKYGVHGINVEVCDRCMILDKDFNQKRTANVTTMGCETYVNFFRTFMAVYDPKDKKEYAPNLPWAE